MDFPMFHLDGIGNRMLIAVIAVVHVIINHPLAVGFFPLVTFFEWKGHKTQDVRWDHFAKRITFIVFIITTTIGALTGVGIWLSTSLVSPFAIGSLLRVFFWAWFLEWGVFVTEVILLLAYYLTWDSWKEGRWKKAHIFLGASLAFFSWLTMAVIVAILGFMMSSGSWTKDFQFWSAVFNPVYVPQLAFRTTFALMTAGLFVWMLVGLIPKVEREFRLRVTRFVSGWTLVWMPLCGGFAAWYLSRVPEAMVNLIPVGMMTQKFVAWQSTFLWATVIVLIAIGLTALIGMIKPRWIPRPVLILPFCLGIALLGHFERIREFIRKPYVIADYMYSNGIRVDEVEYYRHNGGILAHSTFTEVTEVTEENKLVAGRDVFAVACSRCHTTNGFNGIVQKFEKLYGPDEWDPNMMAGFVRGMHVSHPYMPPFPGNEPEIEALVAYVQDIHAEHKPLVGAQVAGIPRRGSSRSRNVPPAGQEDRLTAEVPADHLPQN